jgi:gliding motility-associated-like protein
MRGLNIFTNISEIRMKFLLSFLLVIFWPFVINLHAQLTITATPATGCDTLIVQFGLSPLAGVDTIQNITWDFGNSINLSNTVTPVVEYNSPGTYTVTCLINNNTTLTSSGLIEVRKGPLAIFTSKDTLGQDGLNKFFEAAPQPVGTNTYTYDWEFSDGISYITSAFLHTFPIRGIYGLNLTITDQTGCSSTTSAKIMAGHFIDVPNVFSPNADDINDYLLIRTNGINLFSLEIYTRSGIMVFKAESPTLVWDGRSLSGHEMSPGIYYYVVKQLDGEAGLETRGFLHLMR